MNYLSNLSNEWQRISEMDPRWCGSMIDAAISGHQMINHYTDVTMDTIASQITSLTIVYSTVYSDADQRWYQSSASLAFVWGIHRRPVNSPHKWPVTRKMFPFDDVIMKPGTLRYNGSPSCSASAFNLFPWVEFRYRPFLIQCGAAITPKMAHETPHTPTR